MELYLILYSLLSLAFILSLSVSVYWIKQKYADARAIDALSKRLVEVEEKALSLVKLQDVTIAKVVKEMQDEFGAMNRRISATETLRSTVRNPLLNRPS